MGTPFIVALGWRSGVGKDTVADYLMYLLSAARPPALRGDGVMMASKIAMSELIKKAASAIASSCGVDLPGYRFFEESPILKDIPLPCGSSPRALWVAVGELYRRFNPEVWMLKALSRAQSASTAFVIIPDVRKTEELAFWKERGALMVNILGDGERCATATVDDTAPWDLAVENKRHHDGNTSGALDAAIEIWNKGILPKLEEKYAKQTAGSGGEPQAPRGHCGDSHGD